MICATDRAVLVLHVADHLAAPVLAEVDVEVRHRDAFGIEEALEQQPEAQRIEIGDRQRIGDQRARARTAARPDRDVVRLRPFDEVGTRSGSSRETSSLDLDQFTVALQFDIETVRERSAELFQRVDGDIVLPIDDQLRECAVAAAGERDQPFGMLEHTRERHVGDRRAILTQGMQRWRAA
jgi:hypothetical protein